MSKVYVKLLLGLFAMGISVLSFAQVSVTATGGTTGPTSYAFLKLAIDAINAGTHTGAVTITISSNITETQTSQLSPSGTGTASYTSLTIKPAASTNPVVSGNLPNGILWAIGSNITIDGSNNGSTTRNLTFNNTDTVGGNLGPITLFSTGTTVNSGVTVKNCIIKSGYYPILVAGISSTGLIPGYFSNLTI